MKIPNPHPYHWLKHFNWKFVLVVVLCGLFWCLVLGCSHVRLTLADGTEVSSWSFLTDKGFGSAMYESDPNSVYFHIDNLESQVIEGLLEVVR